MLEAVRTFLADHGYPDVYLDYLPDPTVQRDVIYLKKWEHMLAEINDGTGVQFIQVQVRRGTYKEANQVCRELFLLLDSGTEESLLALTDDGFCIARPRRGPLLLERGAMPHVTFYFELALWGEN